MKRFLLVVSTLVFSGGLSLANSNKDGHRLAESLGNVHPGDTTRIVSFPMTMKLTNLRHQKTPITPLTGTQEYYLFIFLSPECPLCQNYSSVLNKLFARYKDTIFFYGIIPGKSYSGARVEKFRGDYGIGFGLLFDDSFQLIRLLHATTTPEVFLVNRRNEIVYSGLIDNWIAGLGVNRAVATKHYLADAIEAGLHHLPITIKTTRPIGCMINNY